jgi:hypothetical protein
MKGGCFMKSTFKFIGFIAVVAVIGLLSACDPDDTERIVTFENQSSREIQVTVTGWEKYPEGGAAVFDLPAWSGQLAASYPQRQISKNGSDIKAKDIDWYIKGSNTPDLDKIMYEAYIESKTKVIFKDKD